MSSYIDATGLVFSDGSIDYTSTPAAVGAQAASGLTQLDFTGIPSWARRVSVAFYGLSSAAASVILRIQLGTATNGIIAVGYTGTQVQWAAGTPVATAWSGSQCVLTVGAGSDDPSGVVVFNLLGSRTWVMSFVGGGTNGLAMCISAGEKSLPSNTTLDRLRVSTVAGNTFDGGTVNVYYE